MTERPIDIALRLAQGKGWNQTDFAAEIGASSADVSNWKRRGMPTDRYERVAESLGVTVDELMGRSSLAERLTQLMATTRWPIERVAQVAEVHEDRAARWLSGADPALGLVEATRLADQSGFSAVWVATGKGNARSAVAPGDGGLEPEFAGKARPYKKIPIIGTAKLGNDGFYEELSPFEGGGDGFIEMTSQDPQAYGLRVRGQSMFPSIRDGWFVVVEPNGQLRSGEYVLIKLKDGRKMVKELLFKRSGSIEVLSVNGGERMTFDFPDIESTQAVGAVVPPSKWHPA